MGERQRVMIARALSTEPSLLLADEPTGSLDTQRGREVLELLRELCRERGVAVVLVSHDPMAAEYADRVLALRDGRLTDWRRIHSRGRSRSLRPRATRETRERPAPLPRAPARAPRAGVPRGARDRRGGGAAVRLAGLELEPAELGGGALARDRRQRHAAAAGARPAGLPAEHARAGARDRRACARRRRCWKPTPTRSGPGAASRSSWSARTRALTQLGGALVRHAELTPFGGIGAVVLPAPLAHAIGVTQVRPGSDPPARRAHRHGAAVRAAARTPDRRARGNPGGAGAALLRAGTDRRRRAREPHPRAAGARRRSARARGAAADRRGPARTSSRSATTRRCSRRPPRRATSRPRCSRRSARWWGSCSRSTRCCSRCRSAGG